MTLHSVPHELCMQFSIRHSKEWLPMSKHSKTLLILIIITVALIWFQSCLPPDASSQESGFVMNRIVKPFLRFITGREAEVSEYFIRKLGHFTEYLILGLFVSLYAISAGRVLFHNQNKTVRSTASQALTVDSSAPFTLYPLPCNYALFILHSAFFCILTAFIDETIQIFSGRGASIKDVWIDTFGALAGILIVLLFKYIFKPKE